MRDLERRLRALEANRIARGAPSVVSIGSLAWDEAVARLPRDLMYPPVVREWFDANQRWYAEDRPLDHSSSS